MWLKLYMACSTTCKQCTSKNSSTGHRCKNKTSKWSPKCHVHREVEIKPSTLGPNSGKGVFAIKDLKRNTIVGNYKIGTKKMSSPELDKHYPGDTLAEYVWSAPGNTEHYDARQKPRPVAAMFNACREADKRRLGCKKKAKISGEGLVVLNQGVKKGEEIFIGYGNNYFK